LALHVVAPIRFFNTHQTVRAPLAVFRGIFDVIQRVHLDLLKRQVPGFLSTFKKPDFKLR
jgi:hypothetical protein